MAAKTVQFGEEENSFEIEFVTVGSTGNPDDLRKEFPSDDGSNFIGGVDYVYGMARFEVTCEAVTIVNRVGGLPFPFPPDDNCRFSTGPKSPGGLGFFDAHMFVNWLNTSSGFEPAYNVIDGTSFLWSPSDLGYDPDNPLRNSLARYFLPNGDEFHKAAYYDPVTETYLDYATGSNVMPEPVKGGTEPNTLVINRILGELPLADVNNAGGLSAFGTMAQVGNASEWEEDGLWYNVGEEAGLPFSYQATRFPEPFTGSRGFRVVSLDLGRLLDCNGDDFANEADLSCSNQAGTTSELLTELALLQGDLNADGFVNFADFLILSSNFNQDVASYLDGDINGDGTVNFPDFLILSVNFEGAVAAVPEPASLVLMGLAFLGFVRRRRSRRVG